MDRESRARTSRGRSHTTRGRRRAGTLKWCADRRTPAPPGLATSDRTCTRGAAVTVVEPWSSQTVIGCPSYPAAPRLKKKTPRRPPTTPIGVSAASNDRESQLGIGEEPLVAEELEVVVAAQLGVAAEVDVAGELAPALVAARAEGEHAVGAEPQVVARVTVERLARQQAAAARGVFVARATSCRPTAARTRGRSSSRGRSSRRAA